jgi:general L-amino acid transport system substrate-binding protein
MRVSNAKWNDTELQRVTEYLRLAGVLLVALAAWLFAPAHAGEVLDGVKARGQLRCGVSEGIAGFSEQDTAGR